MTFPQAPPASRELNQKRLVDIVRIGHDTLDKEHQLLQNAILGIINFQLIESDPKSGKVYQYMIDNQEEYNEHEVIICSALNSFEPVINDSKNNLFKLEMQIPSDVSFDMPPPIQPMKQKGNEAETKDTRSLFEKMKGTPKKTRLVTPDDPYQDGLPFLRETKLKMDRLHRFIEYQAYGIDLAMKAPYLTMLSYLRFHRTRFRFDMVPTILRVHKQWIELVKANEKIGAIRIASKLDEEIFKTRNDFQFQKPP